MKKKRTIYSPEERRRIIKLFNQMIGSQNTRINAIRSISGYEKLQYKYLKGWMENKIRGGRPICLEFEQQVASKLILCNISAAGSAEGDNLEIIANVIYSYDIVRQAALSIRNTGQRWRENSSTKNLKFSDKWVRGFLNRLHFTKRRITNLPSQSKLCGHICHAFKQVFVRN